MFLRPTMNLNTIGERHTTTATLLKPDNGSLLESLDKSLKQVKNIRTVVIHLQKGISNATNRSVVKKGVWGSLQKFTYHALSIVEVLRHLSSVEPLPIVQQVGTLGMQQINTDFVRYSTL